MNSPLISIVTVVYNGVTTLEQTMLSVLNQTYKNIEYIVIDGGSTDGTIDVIKKHEDRLAYWVSERDKGIYDAMNKGIDRCTGEWVNFMNSGDSFYSNSVLENLEFDRRADVIYGNVNLISEENEYIRSALPICFLEKGMAFCHQASFIKSSKARYDTSFTIAADYNLFYNLYQTGSVFLYQNFCIANYEKKEGLSAMNPIVSLQEIYKIQERTIDIYFFLKIGVGIIYTYASKVLPLSVMYRIRMCRIKTEIAKFNHLSKFSL